MIRSVASVALLIASFSSSTWPEDSARAPDTKAGDRPALAIQSPRTIRSDIFAAAGTTHPLPLFIEVIGTSLLVGGGGGGDTTFFVHDRMTGRVRSVFGREGSGPGEFRSIGALTIRWDSGTGRQSVWAFDRALGRLTEIDLRNPNSPQIGRTVSGELAGQYSAYWLSSTAIVGVGAFTDKRLTLYDSTGSRLRSVGELPLYDEGVPATVAHQALQPSIAVSASGDRIAVGARYSGQVDLYSMPEGALSSARVPSPFRPTIDVGSNGAMLVFRTDRNTRFGYISLTASTTRIYALFSGRTRGQFPGRANYARELHVFNWSGRLIEVARLDRDVFSIASTADGSILYGISHEPDSEILKFSLGTRR